MEEEVRVRITSMRLTDIRSFPDTGVVDLGPITVFVGKNNVGKSTLLRAVGSIQSNSGLTATAVRHGSDSGRIELGVEDMPSLSPWGHGFSDVRSFTIEFARNQGMVLALDRPSGGPAYAAPAPDTEPMNLVFPYLSSRRAGVANLVGGAAGMQVGTLANLAARVDRLQDRHHFDHERFEALLTEVIGLPLSAIPLNEVGKQVGMWVDRASWIPITDMGEGVAQMLGLITQLCVAEGKVFLLEEIENDIHPEALKTLLRAIVKSAESNQFIVSTHNNLVLRHLGAVEGAVIHQVRFNEETTSASRLARAEILRVGPGVEERVQLLSELGYEMSDLDLHDGWLILEESSAERIIRQYLIPWFAPELRRVRTVAARGAGELSRTFEALQKLVLFAHLEERYRGRVLLIADGDTAGLQAVGALREQFPTHEPHEFRTWSADCFERYYPNEFRDQVAAIDALADRRERRRGKRELLERVLSWIEHDQTQAREAFMVSAAEVVDTLRWFEERFSVPHGLPRL